MSERGHYQRLPGRAGFFILNRAYLGPDHILAVQTVFVREKYRRFFFRDIAAFSIHRTERAFVFNVIAAVSFLFCLGIAWLLQPGPTDVAPVGTVIWGLFALAALIWLIANLVLGPTCTCYIRTAVQTVELPSISRVPRAMKARALIIERVRSAQGETAAALAPAVEGAAALAAPVALRDQPTVRASAAAGQTPPRASRTAAVRSLGVTALGAIVGAAAISYDFIEPGLSGALAVATGILLALGAAIAQLVLARGGRLSRLSMAVAWAVPGAVVIGVGAAYVALIAVVASDPLAIESGAGDPFTMVNALPPGTNAVVDGCYLTMAALFTIIAVVGGVSWFSEHMRLRSTGREAAPAPPGAPS